MGGQFAYFFFRLAFLRRVPPVKALVVARAAEAIPLPADSIMSFIRPATVFFLALFFLLPELLDDDFFALFFLTICELHEGDETPGLLPQGNTL